MTPELSRIVALDTIGTTVRTFRVEADVDERRRLAGRFGWAAIDLLEADVNLVVQAGGIAATGHLRARLAQKCVATGDPVHEEIDQPFAVRFVDAGLLAAGGEEVELSDSDLEVVEFSGSVIDVGEAIAQTIALSVDPYPRCPDADAKLRAAGVVAEGEVPSGALAGLKDLLKR